MTERNEIILCLKKSLFKFYFQPTLPPFTQIFVIKICSNKIQTGMTI